MPDWSGRGFWRLYPQVLREARLQRTQPGSTGKIVVDKGNTPETWKAVEGYWDGSLKDCAKGGCGVVIKGATEKDG